MLKFPTQRQKNFMGRQKNQPDQSSRKPNILINLQAYIGSPNETETYSPLSNCTAVSTTWAEPAMAKITMTGAANAG